MTDRKHPLANCSECPLKNAAYVPASGPEDADIVVVSRSPARGDTYTHVPFSGASGKLLDHLLQMNGVNRKDVLVTNVVSCHTDKPSKQAIQCCKPRLDSEVSRCQKITILCGSEAASAVVGKGSVLASRGVRLAIPTDPDPSHVAVVTFNPAAALRDDGIFQSLVSDFKRALQAPIPFKPPQVEYTEDPREAEQWYQTFYGQPVIAVDIEATGLHHTSHPLSIALCCNDQSVKVVGRKGLSGSWSSLKKLLERTDSRFLWHNGKYDTQVLRHNGIDTRIDEDTMLLSYATDERPSVHVRLESLLYDEFDWPEYEPECIKKGKKVAFTNLTEEEWPLLYKYNGYDTVGCFRLYGVLQQRASDDEVLRPYYDLLIPGANAYAKIETRGVQWDVQKAIEVRNKELMPGIHKANAKANRATGLEINLNSPKQVAEYLYDYCGLEDPEINHKTPRSTDEESRKALRSQKLEPATRKFLNEMDIFKKLDKIRSTYIDGVIKQVDSDGRLRCSFKLHGTETGRRSAEKPNLQNQPRGPQIRQLYTAPQGSNIMNVDYSQAELRTAAMLSQDPTMLDIYHSGRDFHDETAANFYGAEFTYEERQRSKNINFGVFYGQGAAAFAQMYSIPYGEAEEYIHNFWRMFPVAASWKRSIEDTILTKQELVSAFGRKRRFHLITNQNKDASLREGVNFVISSVAADFTLSSLIILEYEFQDTLLEVHDSLLFEVTEQNLEIQAERTKQVMESIPCDALGWSMIPFLVDIQIGDNWGFMEPWQSASFGSARTQVQNTDGSVTTALF